MNEKLMTVDELCEWLRIGRTTVWQWRKEGMPHLNHGRSVRFDKAKVQEWLERKNGHKN